MTGVLGLGLAALFALLDLAAPAGASPPVARRLLRALPAGVLAVTLRLADAPPLVAAALLAVAVADALRLDAAGRESMGGWTTMLLSQLLLAVALWELASPGLLLRQPWRAAGGLAVLGGGLALLRIRPAAGPLRSLAPLTPLLLAASAAAAGAQGSASLTPPFLVAVGSWSAAAAWEAWRAEASGPTRAERALRSAAALTLAWPLLPLR